RNRGAAVLFILIRMLREINAALAQELRGRRFGDVSFLCHGLLLPIPNRTPLCNRSGARRTALLRTFMLASLRCSSMRKPCDDTLSHVDDVAHAVFSAALWPHAYKSGWWRYRRARAASAPRAGPRRG